MRRSAATIACVLVAGCGGSTEAMHAATTTRAATQRARPSLEVSLRGPDTRRVVFDHPLTIKGVARPGDLGRTVRLLSSESPYPVSEPVQSTKTGEGGSFSFTVRPHLNTMYSVEVGERVSRHIQVYAMPDGNFRVEPIAPGRGYFVYEITYPAGVTPTRLPVVFYAHMTRDARRLYTRIGQAPFRRTGRTHAIARVAITLRHPADDAVACVPTSIAPNLGAPPIRDCGRGEVRVPGH